MMAAEAIAAGTPVAVSGDGDHVEPINTSHPILVAGADIDAGAEVLIGEDGIALPVRPLVSPTAETEPAPPDGDPYGGAPVAIAAERRGLLDYPPGLHDMPAAHYYARIKGVASKSTLDLVRRAPAVYRAWLNGDIGDDDAAPLAFGSALHCAALEPELYAVTYAVEPDFGDCRKTENKKIRDAWREANAGRKLLSEGDGAAIAAMCRALREHETAGPLLFEGHALREVSAVWTDEETGILCKARADLVRPDLGIIVDLKTTQDGRAKAFEKSVANYGYARQAAFYRDGFAKVGVPVEAFVFVAVEKSAPWLVSLFMLDDDSMTRGAAMVREDLRTLAECLERDEWPGHPAEIQTISLPPWAV